MLNCIKLIYKIRSLFEFCCTNEKNINKQINDNKHNGHDAEILMNQN